MEIYLNVYRVVSIFVFILFHTAMPKALSIILLVTAILSDFFSGYLVAKGSPALAGGKIADLFSDRCLACVLIIFLVIKHYPLFPLLVILAKEIFMLSFRYIEIDGILVISPNRIFDVVMSFVLCVTVLLDINYLSGVAEIIIWLSSALNCLYLVRRIVLNFTNLKEIFNS